jgi:hypothetical protein
MRSPASDDLGRIHTRRPRSTGLPVTQIDAEKHPDFDPEEGGRFVTLCETHSTFCQHDTFSLARAHTASPEEWCEPCREVAEKRGRDKTSGFTEEDRERARQSRSEAARKRAEAREQEKRRRSAEERAQEVWARFTVLAPPLEPEYTEEEDAAREEIRVKIADLVVGEKEDGFPAVLAALQEERAGLYRTAYVRALRRRGWTLERNGHGRVLRKGEERIPLPPGYLS